MVLFNYATKELTAKVVYYGPGLCGKTTNLQFIHENLPETVKGKMLSLATKTDRTLFFDFLPIDLGEIRGMKTRVQLYTVPGQVFYNETRRLVLKGADGIVFVADSQETMLGANVESFRNLEENLKAHGMSLAEMPHVIQFNKRDLPKLSSIEEMNAALNRYNAPFYESVATTGIGVQDTLKAVVKLVLLHLTRKYDPKSASSPRAERPAPVVAAAAPAPPPAPRTASPSARTIPLSGVPLSPPPSAPPLVASGPSLHVPAEPVAATGGVFSAPVAAPEAPRAHGSGPVVPLSGDSLADRPFADDEIDGLVEEVDAYASAAGDEGDSAVWMGEPAEEEPARIEIEEEASSPFATADSAFGSTVPIEDYAPAVGRPGEEPATLAAAEVQAVFPDRTGADLPAFELDRGFDPEWPRADAWSASPVETPSASAPTETRAPSPFAPEPDALESAEPSEVEASDDGVYLAEVADEAEIFDDPGLEVASLAAGEARDIIVPVEIRAGTETRRFKLSVRLRLDPVDRD
jgi:signal recognition particle receptor subunit beta